MVLPKCSVNCIHKNCLERITLRSLANLRQHFWYHVPSREERRTKIETILKKARVQYTERAFRKEIDPSQYPNCFCFDIDGQNICEKAYANALGLANDKGATSKVWKDEVKAFTGTPQHIYNAFIYPDRLDIINCIVIADSDEKYAREKSLNKETSEKQLNDKIRSKQDDAFAFVGKRGSCQEFKWECLE